MAKVKINKNALRIIVTVLVAILTAGALAGGIYFNINSVEQNKIYEKSIAKVNVYNNFNENILVKGNNKNRIFFQTDSRMEANQKAADEALKLKKEYQKNAIMLYCGSVVLLGGNVFLNIKKKSKKGKKSNSANKKTE